MSVLDHPAPTCSVCSHPAGSHERHENPLGAPCTLTETGTGRACWCTGYRPAAPLDSRMYDLGPEREQYMTSEPTPPAALDALERLGPFIRRDERSRFTELLSFPIAREDPPVTHSPLLITPELPHVVRDRDVTLKVVTGHAYAEHRPPGGRSSTVMHLQLLRGEDESVPTVLMLEMTADEAVTAAAAVLAAAGATRHRVIDLGDDLPEVTSEVVDGERTWVADSHTHTHDDAHDVELTMAPVRRRLAVLQHVALAEVRHPEQIVEGVAELLRSPGLRPDPNTHLSPVEARYRAAELLDGLRALGVLAEDLSDRAARHAQADRG